MLYIISLEPLETRYTSQWQRWFKEKFPNSIEISGDTISELNNSQNFLDPFQTNIWKSEQIIKLSKLFRENKINNGDKFLFLDAWHYGIITLKYMASLGNKDIKIYGIWHAGSYDEWDLLGQKKLNYYFCDFEQSLFLCLDKSFVATNFHKNLILSKYKKIDSIYVTGFPYNFKELDKYVLKYPEIDKKEDIVIFPHRLSKEKQPWILEELQQDLFLNGIECIFCQKEKLTKDEYHKLLAKSKIVFSASLQETWGIGTFEGLYLGCIPLVPDYLSYDEMYCNAYKYNHNLILSNTSENKKELLNLIINHIENYNYLRIGMEDNIERLKDKYCTFKNITKEIGEY